MTADQVRAVAYREPFQPFRVHLRSGEHIEIKRSLRTTVWSDRVFFGVNEDPESGVARRMRIVPLHDIDAIEVA
jgi:hypothetical protein